MQNAPVQEDQIILIILIGISLLLLMSVAIIAFFYFSRKKISKTELEKARLAVSHQKELLQATILTQEDERRRIAQDMHDAISSKLNIVSLNANFLKEEHIDSKEANALGESIVNVTATVLESSRRIAHDLLPPALDKFGLVAALEELCDQIEKGGQHRIQTQFSYPANSVPKDNELHLFRIVQELINNTVKYGKADTLQLSLETDTDIVRLYYEDNGVGFVVAEGKLAKGLGLSGIENRAILMNAEFSLESEPGAGVRFVLTKKLID
jgi:signal transduction histidine kinase